MNTGTERILNYGKIGVLPGGIPKLVHCFWTGSEMPATYRLLLNRFRILHPGWHVKVWSIESIPPLLNHRAFNEITKLAWRADVLRYELVARFGGVWMDLDINWLRPLDGLIGHCEAFTAHEDRGHINNAIFGARPGHPWAWALVTRLDKNYGQHKDQGSLADQVGVQYFTRMVEEFKTVVTVFHAGIFHPCRNDKLAHADFSSHPTAHGFHFYNSSQTLGKVQHLINAGKIRIPSHEEAEAGATIEIDCDRTRASASVRN